MVKPSKVKENRFSKASQILRFWLKKRKNQIKYIIAIMVFYWLSELAHRVTILKSIEDDFQSEVRPKYHSKRIAVYHMRKKVFRGSQDDSIDNTFLT